MSRHLSDYAVGQMRRSAAKLRRAIDRRHDAAMMATTQDAGERVRDWDLEVRLAAIGLLCLVEVQVADDAAAELAAELGVA